MAVGYFNGVRVGKKMYLDGLQKYGFEEAKYREKTVATCRKYARDMTIKQTKKGEILTPNKRKFYQGVVDFLTAPNRVY